MKELALFFSLQFVWAHTISYTHTLSNAFSNSSNNNNKKKIESQKSPPTLSQCLFKVDGVFSVNDTTPSADCSAADSFLIWGSVRLSAEGLFSALQRQQGSFQTLFSPIQLFFFFHLFCRCGERPETGESQAGLCLTLQPLKKVVPTLEGTLVKIQCDADTGAGTGADQSWSGLSF